MSLPATLLRAIESAARGLQPRTKAWPALQGDGSGVVDVPGSAGFVYVRMPDGSVAKAFNIATSHANDLPVWVGYEPLNPSLLRVLDFRYTYANPDTQTAIGPHHATHEFLNPHGGGDVVYSQARQLMPLRLNVVSGFTVQVQPSPFWTGTAWALSPAGTLDLSGYQPTGGARWVLVYISTTGDLAARAGTTSTGVGPSIGYDQIPAAVGGETPLAAVALYAGQSAVTESFTIQDVVDLRFVPSFGASVGSGTAGEVAYWGTDGRLAGDSLNNWDPTNHRQIIGGVSADVPSGFLSKLIVMAQDALAGLTAVAWGSVVPAITLARSLGSKSSPSAVTSDTVLGRVNANGYGATDWGANSRARLQAVAAETWTDSHQGTRWEARVTQPGSTTEVDAFDVLYDRVKVTGHDLILDAAIEVDVTGAADGQILKRSGGKWVPGSASVASLGWFNVKDYGAAGDGTTNDTTAVTNAITALNAAGRGVLYFPAGSYKTSGGFTISADALLLGDGPGDVYATSYASLVQCTSGSAVLFTLSAKRSRIVNLAMKNTSGGTPTAGAAVKASGSDIAQCIDLESCLVYGFYDNVVQDGAQWSIRNCFISGNVRYGIYVHNTTNPDSGDWMISDCVLSSDLYDSTAGIRIESSGGGKIINLKTYDGWVTPTKRFTNVIDLQPTGNSVILLIDNCSIEYYTNNGVNVAVGSHTWSAITVRGCEFGCYFSTNRAIQMSATTLGNLKGIVITDNLFRGDSGITTLAAVDLTKVDQANILNNINVDSNFSGGMVTQSGCTNIVTSAGVGPGTTGKIAAFTSSTAIGDSNLKVDATMEIDPTGASNGQLLAYNSSTLKWTPVTDASVQPVYGVDYSQVLYTATSPTVINLGTSTDGSFVDADATNAKIAFTPATAGKYKVTFIFSHYMAGTAVDVYLRLTDGTTNSPAEERYTAAATHETVVTLSYVFDWAASAQTVKLQKRNITMTSATANAIELDSASNLGLLMIVERIGSISQAYLGASAPGGTYAGEMWLETDLTPPVLNVRNDTNTGWYQVGASSSTPGQVVSIMRWAADGSSTAYTLPDVADGLELIFDNGSVVDPFNVDLSSDHTQVVFTSAPTAGHVLVAQYAATVL